MNVPQIIFEDENLLILDKPSGWIVNEAKTTKDIPVLQKWLKKNFDYETSQGREYRSGIVHRLDKETSGILLVAKTKKAFKNLQAQFKNRKVDKVYTALVHGKVEPEKGEINVPVGRLPWNRQRFGVVAGGRLAETNYKVVGYYELKSDFKHQTSYTLLELYPKTGRTHQIRVHLKHIRYPIVADEFYAGRKTAKSDREWCPRLFLHANKISFKHPETGKRVSYKSPLPSELESVLKKLSKS